MCIHVYTVHLFSERLTLHSLPLFFSTLAKEKAAKTATNFCLVHKMSENTEKYSTKNNHFGASGKHGKDEYPNKKWNVCIHCISKNK